MLLPCYILGFVVYFYYKIINLTKKIDYEYSSTNFYGLLQITFGLSLIWPIMIILEFYNKYIGKK